MNKIILIIILILSILGSLFSSYLTYIHIKFEQSPEYKSGCSWFSGGKNDPCKTVAASKYSEIFGIPVALYGTLYFLFIFFITIFYFLAEIKIIPSFLLLISGFGVIFYIYLTYLELFKIRAICPLCVTTSIFNFGIFLGTIFIRYKNKISKID